MNPYLNAGKRKKNDNVQAALYKSVSHDFQFQYFPGVIVVPRAIRDPIVFRVYKPYSIRQQKFGMVKEKTPPVVPAPDPDATLIGQMIAFPLPKQGSTNPPSFNYAVSGIYTYLESKPSHPLSGFALPINPFPFEFPSIEERKQMMGGDPRFIKPDFQSGKYFWPFTQITPEFFDPQMSVTDHNSRTSTQST